MTEFFLGPCIRRQYSVRWRKMLTFDYGRYTKVVIGTFASDQMTCFDRMMIELTNVVAQTNDMKEEACECRAEVIDQSERKIKTICGVSANSYKNEEENYEKA